MSVIEAPEVQTAEPLVEPDPVLMRAAEIVRERWQQGNYGKRGGPRCALGAIAEACDFRTFEIDERIISDVHQAENSEHALRLSDSLGGTLVHRFNDCPGRTAEEVAEALERAAYGL